MYYCCCFNTHIILLLLLLLQLFIQRNNHVFCFHSVPIFLTKKETNFVITKATTTLNSSSSSSSHQHEPFIKQQTKKKKDWNSNNNNIIISDNERSNFQEQQGSTTTKLQKKGSTKQSSPRFITRSNNNNNNNNKNRDLIDGSTTRSKILTTTSTTRISSQNHDTTKTKNTNNLRVVLQKCTTPTEVLHNVGMYVNHETDPDGTLGTLILIRLCKLCITIHNENQFHSSLSQTHEVVENIVEMDKYHHRKNENESFLHNLFQTTEKGCTSTDDLEIVISIIHHVADKIPSVLKTIQQEQQPSLLGSMIRTTTNTRRKKSSNNPEVLVESIVEGTKSCAVIARILFSYGGGCCPSNYHVVQEKNRLLFQNLCEPIIQSWYEVADAMMMILNSTTTCFRSSEHEKMKKHDDDDENNDLKMKIIMKQKLSFFDEHHITGLKWSFDTFQFIQRMYQLDPSTKTDQHHHHLCEDNVVVIQLPILFQRLYEQYNIPFEIYPGFMLLPTNNTIIISSSTKTYQEHVDNNFHKSHKNQKEMDVNDNAVTNKPITPLTVPLLQQQVHFTVDEIVAAPAGSTTTGTTTTITKNTIIPERRQTAWEGDDHVFGFQYSGKVMKRYHWSECVLQTRNILHQRLVLKKNNNENGTSTTTMMSYYDGCLINLYDHSNSGMRYHSDPDQGTMWDYDTTVVSVGASRKFAFRSIRTSSSNQQQEQDQQASLSSYDNQPQKQQSQSQSQSQSQQPHTFVVMDGDITHMYHDCQQRYQHTVKKADDPNEMALRASLVFKRTLDPS